MSGHLLIERDDSDVLRAPRLIVGGRNNVPGKGSKTTLCRLSDDQLHQFAEPPSAGDNSYASFIARSDKAWSRNKCRGSLREPTLDRGAIHDKSDSYFRAGPNKTSVAHAGFVRGS